MAQERRRKGTLDTLGGLAKQAAKDVKPGERPVVWIREDGAFCVGNECIVIKPGADKALNIQVNRNNGCDVEGLAEAIWDTIGRGGDATFKVQGVLEGEDLKET